MPLTNASFICWQVYDLQDHRPGPVLQRIWANLDAATAAGDPRADYYRRNLRILAAGGDGTVAWILGTIAELKLEPPPRVAVSPDKGSCETVRKENA